MNLRPYQVEAVAGTDAAWRDHRTALGILPTGGGKTVVFAHVLKKRAHLGRALVMAHRQELVYQAARTIKRVCGVEPAMEMGDCKVIDDGFHKSPIVVASKDSLRGKRLTKFNPEEFATAIVDEAHHATAQSYLAPLDHFQNAKVLGVTATPDRTDEEALGKVFKSVAFNITLEYMIRQAWLVPIRQKIVVVDEMEFAGIGKVAGDFNQGQLADMLESEKVLHGMTSATIEFALGLPPGTLLDLVRDHKAEEIPERLASMRNRSREKRTLVFTSRLHQAEKVCELINRLVPDSAVWVSGNTPDEDRAKMFADFGAGRYLFLVNVGVATEGWDDPATDGKGVRLVSIMRPTMSRSLYSQMIGRGTRPLPGVVDDCGPDVEDRREAIAQSHKPFVTVLDFVGNANVHSLVHVGDVLGDTLEDAQAATVHATLERKAKAEEEDEGVDVLDEIDRTVADIERQAQERARRILVGAGDYTTRDVDPFAVCGITMKRVPGWFASKPVSDKQREVLERRGLWNPKVVTNMGIASQLIDVPTPKQKKALLRVGYTMDELSKMKFRDARAAMDAVAANGWKRPVGV